jgi:hypothetical protein
MDKKKHNWRLFAGPLLLLAGILLGIFEPNVPILYVSIMTALGVIFIVMGLRMTKSRDLYKGDERTRKIWAYSAAYSWWLTYIAIAILYFIDYTKLASLTVDSVLGILLFTIAITQIVISWIMSRKGDVQ